MPYLLVLSRDEETSKEVFISDRITTIGASPECDIQINDDRADAVHAHISFDGKQYHVSATTPDRSLVVNGKKTRDEIVVHGSVIEIGSTKLVFIKDILGKDRKPPKEHRFEDLRGVVEFSEKLMTAYNVDDLLRNLLDHLVKLTRAETGFIVLIEGGKLSLKSATSLGDGNLQDSLEKLSDTIIAKVVREKRPVIVSDAVLDEEFRNAESVINLHLRSVMCVPLIVRERMLGLIYLGSQRVENLFEKADLEILKVFASEASLLLQNALLLNELKRENSRLLDKIDSSRFGELTGNSGPVQNLFREIIKIAKLDGPVLILGEEGTEKEAVAHEIHTNSGRRGAFSSLKATLYNELEMDIELFGYTKGSLPGALYPRKGKAQLSRGGTLYIEDAENIPESIQIKLLRILTDGRVTRLGSGTPEKIDVRIVLSSKGLEEAVRANTFNNELYNRCLGSIIRIPPLRERGEDIKLLANNYLIRFSKQMEKEIYGFTPGALVQVMDYKWPGNLLELENRIKRAVMMSEADYISPDALEFGD